MHGPDPASPRALCPLTESESQVLRGLHLSVCTGHSGWFSPFSSHPVTRPICRADLAQWEGLGSAYGPLSPLPPGLVTTA